VGASGFHDHTQYRARNRRGRRRRGAVHRRYLSDRDQKGARHSAGAERIHIEDFAQVFGIYPSRKYEGAAYRDIAAALGVAVSCAAALEFVRRLALAAVTGNGDMHVKNWSLIYRGAGDKPELAPVYDVLSTIPYIPADAMALSLGGERSFKAMNVQRWKAFANRARLPEAAVLKAVTETVERVNQTWWSLPEREVVPIKVLERIDGHVKMITPILGTHAH